MGSACPNPLDVGLLNHPRPQERSSGTAGDLRSSGTKMTFATVYCLRGSLVSELFLYFNELTLHRIVVKGWSQNFEFKLIRTLHSFSDES